MTQKEDAIKFAEFIGKKDLHYLYGLIQAKEFNEKWVNDAETEYLTTEELYNLYKLKETQCQD